MSPNGGCESKDILEIMSIAKEKEIFDEISYEECYSIPGCYISLEKGNYIGFIRREEEPATITKDGKPTRITLVNIIKKEGKTKRQIISFDKRPIPGTSQILKNEYATKETFKENHGFKEFLNSIYYYFN